MDADKDNIKQACDERSAEMDDMRGEQSMVKRKSRRHQQMAHGHSFFFPPLKGDSLFGLQVQKKSPWWGEGGDRRWGTQPGQKVVDQEAERPHLQSHTGSRESRRDVE
jgi:hypothetical protein